MTREVLDNRKNCIGWMAAELAKFPTLTDADLCKRAEKRNGKWKPVPRDWARDARGASRREEKATPTPSGTYTLTVPPGGFATELGHRFGITPAPSAPDMVSTPSRSIQVIPAAPAAPPPVPPKTRRLPEAPGLDRLCAMSRRMESARSSNAMVSLLGNELRDEVIPLIQEDYQRLSGEVSILREELRSTQTLLEEATAPETAKLKAV